MTFRISLGLIALVLLLNLLGNVLGLYGSWPWYDMPMHFGGGFAMGVFAIALWQEGIEEVRFKGRLAKHLKWWLVPLFVIGFVALVATLWEFHEFGLDILLDQEPVRQVNLEDTMADFFLGLLGAVVAIIGFHRFP